MSNLKILVEKRSVARSAVTRIHSGLDDLSNSSNMVKLKTKIKLENLSNELDRLNEAIQSEKFKTDLDGIQDELLKCEDYSDKIIDCQALLDELASPVSNIDGTGGSGHNATGGEAFIAAPRSKLKCPTAPLPRFTSSAGENIELFLDQFNEVLTKFNYTDYDKFLLLKEQISGRALLLLKDLKPSQIIGNKW